MKELSSLQRLKKSFAGSPLDILAINVGGEKGGGGFHLIFNLSW